MKKIPLLSFLLFFFCFSSYALYILLPTFFRSLKNFLEDGMQNDIYKASIVGSTLYLLFALCSFFLCVYVLIKTLREMHAHHAARLTYEEYKERAKQKKLEKTRKKMQELEEKLQKESTE